MEERVEYNPFPQKRTMTRAEFARAMGDEDHEAKRDLMIAEYVLAGVKTTLENASPDDLRVMAQLIERMHEDLLAVRSIVLSRLREDGSTCSRSPDRPVMLDDDADAKFESVRRGDQNEVYMAARSPDDSPGTKRTLSVAGLGKGEILVEWELE